MSSLRIKRSMARLRRSWSVSSRQGQATEAQSCHLNPGPGGRGGGHGHQCPRHSAAPCSNAMTCQAKRSMPSIFAWQGSGFMGRAGKGGKCRRAGHAAQPMAWEWARPNKPRRITSRLVRWLPPPVIHGSTQYLIGLFIWQLPPSFLCARGHTGQQQRRIMTLPKLPPCNPLRNTLSTSPHIYIVPRSRYDAPFCTAHHSTYKGNANSHCCAVLLVPARSGPSVSTA